MAAIGGATTVSMGGSTIPTAGGSSSAMAVCSANTNLIAEAASDDTMSWIGGDPASTADNPCGVQGNIAAYSDDGVDKIPGNGDDSVQSPARDPAATDPRARLSPCDGNKCCIIGATSHWPFSGGSFDYTASVWGGGLRITLNDLAGSGGKAPYAGPVKGFNVALSGDLDGQQLRLQYGQSASDSCPPLKTFVGTGTYQVLFTEPTVTCPSWSCSPPCIAPSSNPFSFEIQVVGGDAAGFFEVCIDQLTPIL
jgi:hypothetical protein